MKFLQLMMIFGVSSFLLACANSATGTMQRSEQGNYEQHIEYHSLQIRNSLKIVEIRQRKKTDLLQISADIQNTKAKAAAFQYKFRFYDRDGFEVGTDTRPWTPIIINGKDTATVQATAPNASAVSFKIIVTN